MFLALSSASFSGSAAAGAAPLAMIGGIGVPELLIILVIVLVVFGAGKVPQIGQALGKGIRNFKQASSGDDDVDVTPQRRELTGDADAGRAGGAQHDEVEAHEVRAKSGTGRG